MKRSLVAIVFVAGIVLSFHDAKAAAPTCNGQTATVYVDSGVIVGGPGNGTTFTGTLTASSASVIVGTSGDDTITGSGSADTICPGDGNDTIDGGTGTDTIAFTTNSDTSGITISITGSSSGSITTSTGTSTFTRAESFVGTQYNDTFTMGASGSLTGTVNGGAGSDTIDYSSRSSALSLNMYTGVLTSISGTVSNIENLTAGSGADTIIGNSSANTLNGNGGNDIIFGGDGADTLLGGAGKNILIGGKGADTITTDSTSTGDIDVADETSYSDSSTANTTNLGLIRTEWTGASSYANRIAHIQGTLAGGLNSTAQFKVSTLQYDNAADSINGNAASVKNWYISSATFDTITNTFSGETSTDTSIPVSIASSANPTAAGNDVTFTASSTQTAATGTVTVYKDSTSLGTCTFSSGSCTYLASGLTGGSYSMTAVYGGDTSYSSSTSSAITQVMTDTTAPTLSEVTAVTTPTSDSTPNYTFNTNEAGTITYGGSCSSATTSATSGNNTITFSTLSNGTYSNCTITVTDASSNASSALAVTTFTVDATAPTAAITYSISHAVKSGDSLTITATFNEAMADSPVPKISISGGNTLTATAMTKSSSTVYTYADTVGSGNGTATVALSTGTDLAGNVITSAPTSGSTFTVDNTAPSAPSTPALASADDTGSSNSDAITTQTSGLTFTGTAESSSTVQLYDGVSTTGSSTTATGGNWSIDLSLTAGAHTITAKATDAAGNTSSSSASLTVTVDSTAPTVTEVTAVTTPTSDTTPDYTFNTNEAGTIAYGGSCSSVTTSASSGNNTITFNALADGAYTTCTVQITDAAGNISTALTVTSFTISTATLSSPSDPAANNGGGGGSSAEVPISLIHVAPPQNFSAKATHGFSIKVSDPDQVKKVTMRILGKTYALTHALKSATYSLAIKAVIKVTKAAYVLTINYGSYNVKQYGILSLFAQPSPLPSNALLQKVNALYRQTYGRNPTYEEWLYWSNRVKKGDKKTSSELLGAMQWQHMRAAQAH
ncbi:MAG: Ig-like domain repeat protein [Candidatus Andersenbacteria bacterium]|nr:Ig-like domain repeat protein [Candidatus Andersenbacteria bacterium]